MAIADKWKIYSFDEIGSTNDEIQKYCCESGKNIVVCAKKQTAGRGRRGRSWNCAAGNLFFSLAFEFELQRAGEDNVRGDAHEVRGAEHADVPRRRLCRARHAEALHGAQAQKVKLYVLKLFRLAASAASLNRFVEGFIVL